MKDLHARSDMGFDVATAKAVAVPVKVAPRPPVTEFTADRAAGSVAL